ncbi:RrF2 family transcriptional regulator [Scatolibacter rhodanostii]|uniref:RrF2 family transcriptional regulator n=1 Tax=Scatolibacter rhodanostii TaxID=2014781 RepID=UPI000C07A31C|nr:Rrf2 family transcriptional regulator [Scatolibacter rhodanostii]
MQLTIFTNKDIINLYITNYNSLLNTQKERLQLLQFQITTDYAIRILCYLAAQNNALTQASELAEHAGITYPYTMKIIRQLKSANILESERGPQGGYRIQKNPSEITLYDVIRIMEGDICINRCLAADGFCSRQATGYCQVHNVMERVQISMVSILKDYTLTDFLTSF